MGSFFRFKSSIKNSKIGLFFRKLNNSIRNLSQLKYLLIVYFLVVFLFSLLLWAPFAHANPQTDWYSFRNYINAVFTTASAFSDTGLVVYDTFSYWNTFGQAIIAILILLGGIGIFALKFFIINYIFRRSMTSIGNVQLLQNERGGSDVNTTIKLVLSSVKFLLAVILISGFAMSIYFYYVPAMHTKGVGEYLKGSNGELGYINSQGDWSIAFRFGFFHTISAINNAGFDIVSGNSIMPYQQNYGLQIWIIILFVIGGIGYPTIYDIHEFIIHLFRKEKRKHRFSLFSKVSLISYVLLFLVGLIFALGFELSSHSQTSLWNKIYLPDSKVYYNSYQQWIQITNKNPELLKVLEAKNATNLNATEARLYNILQARIKDNDQLWPTLQEYIKQGPMYGNWFDRTFAIIFTTFSTRSAGFATVNIHDFTTSTTLIYTILMFIGAAPSSTGGGIRTTTFALLVMTTLSVLLGRKRVRMFKRAIEKRTVFMATQTFILAFGLVIIVSLISFTSFDTHGGTIATVNLVQQQNQPVYNSMHIIFEVSSAFGTTGLSSGITKNLNIASKLAFILTMFIGQFGVSSTLLVWKRKKSKDRNYEYIDADLAIG
ncbi:cation transport protein [Mycoplasmopsis mustelae]|uniref:Cation transport protein n=1 Tax=Mycoplasmopsis mustelae TaxID=171289 RepID=A0A4R7UCH0_9BACT|nr:potassium transporter TrkG [Mycoplasmopsis mustelae]TDV24118.1 cation transport protein [Mycoplasmopsis mustelae]